MKIIRNAAATLAGVILLAGCGKAPAAAPRTTATTTVVADLVTSTTQAEAMTTTACLPDTAAPTLAAAQQALQSDQATLDTNLAGRRQVDGAMADIQLTIDNTGRQIEIQQRQVDSDQHGYNNTLAAFNILGTDTARQQMNAAAGYLADSKAVLASWQAIQTKAEGDLARAKATAADFDRAISQDQALVAADQRQVTLAGAAQTGDNCVH